MQFQIGFALHAGLSLKLLDVGLFPELYSTQSKKYYLPVDIKYLIKCTFKFSLTCHNARKKVVFLTFSTALFLICCSLVLFQVAQRDGKVYETIIFIMGLVNIGKNMYQPKKVEIRLE